MNARLVIRPDSGDPVEMALATIQLLDEKVGSTPNSKGLKVLHPKFRVIYGDGIDYDTILGIFTALIENGYSPENICFGMGGALLQKCDRDWERFAMKACELEVMGVKRHVGKKPKTDPSKASKFGIYTPHLVDAEIVNVAADGPVPEGAVEVFPVVFENGFLLKDWSLDEISSFSAMQ
jgi:nicotinamide phosphoribosyltransferase